jgi:short-chain fatty acids transporter
MSARVGHTCATSRAKPAGQTKLIGAWEALPNLINPFWMLPLLGILGLRAREVVGFTFLQLLVHLPVVLCLLWLLAYTLEYHPPAVP